MADEKKFEVGQRVLVSVMLPGPVVRKVPGTIVRAGDDYDVQIYATASLSSPDIAAQILTNIRAEDIEAEAPPTEEVKETGEYYLASKTQNTPQKTLEKTPEKGPAK